ncbi:hypothetical protein DPMN_120687 [Dreissena polymorpha]|uniref:Uncharacterized protein n=1 Tax=Dreissena polymorpha TaxID=45954 RepID=A0A9D4JQD6_DREPO|nr:hypothetical protein DPMN_120687 [Dreissena polymorpha]
MLMAIRAPFFNKYYNLLKKLSSKTSCISLARHIFSNVGYSNTSNRRALMSPTFVPSLLLLRNDSMDNLFQTISSSDMTGLGVATSAPGLAPSLSVSH